MPEFKPTADQSSAISTKGRAVLVSAAAGSGKTKVLTERLMARISEDADIDSFLVITFTKAAAAELKSRITDEISSRLASEPDNKRLRRQSALCRRAQIGTIHSFCSNLLREYCHAAKLSPEFRVIEQDRADAIKARVLERVLEAKYEDPDEGFLLLADTVGRGRDDARLASVILGLHGRMQSHARPEKWAAEQTERIMSTYSDASDTVWGREIMSMARQSAEYWAERMEGLCLDMRGEDKIQKAYGASVAATAESLRSFARSLDRGWDEARGHLPISFPRMVLRNSPNAELSEYVKAVRELCKAACKKLNELLSADSGKLLSDMRRTAPAMEALLGLTLDFDRAYAAEKRRRSELDFSDLEHFTVRLLTDDNGVPTTLAREISGRFTEIMVDEYQDVNRVQDAIFRALSRNGENLFMVGDVKQSVYRFRLADPTIFTEKYLAYEDLDKARGGEPVRIMLRENFRSRREITECVNHVFGTCMSPELGEIAYDENAALRCGAAYDGSVPVPELTLLDLKTDDEEEETPDKVRAEAAFVAGKIRKLVDSGAEASDKNGKRALRYGDIAILMRSANTVGDVYRSELIKAGVPVMNGQGGSFFASAEISSLMCLLAVIDNPHQDVPLIAALRSPFFGFTADELSEIRAEDKSCDFCTALTLHAEHSKKCADFLSVLSELRERSADMTVAELLGYVYGRTDMRAVCAAMRDGENRCRNLSRMTDCALRFEASGYKGLHRFVEWLKQAEERGEEPFAGAEGDAVRIMTVHKSKGLEFPVVFLCDLNRRFNRQDSNDTVTVHPRLGLGPKLTDLDRGIEYPTLARNAVKLRSEREMLSEEMRLLYVALTRARERLYMTAAMKAPELRLQKLMLTVSEPLSPEILLTAQSPAIWLMYACLADKDSRMSLEICRPGAEEKALPETAERALPEADAELLETVKRNLTFAYAHEAASGLPAKITATELKRFERTDDDTVSVLPEKPRSFRRPELGNAEKPLTGAERGTATHMVLQFMDYGRAGSLEEIRSETARLKGARFISERQAAAVDEGSILRLFKSDIGKRILSADKLRREFKFSVLCPARDFFPGGEGEELLLQGVMDCCIEEKGRLTVIDYKTDRVRGEALFERAEVYRSQLRAYAAAAQRITGMEVKECVLYFLDAGKEIHFDFSAEK